MYAKAAKLAETEKTKCGVTFRARLAQEPNQEVEVELSPEEIEEIYWKTFPAFSVKASLRHVFMSIANAMK